jgi:hypothetical protein
LETSPSSSRASLSLTAARCATQQGHCAQTLEPISSMAYLQSKCS